MINKQDMRLLMKALYWSAMTGATMTILYLVWLVFITVYNGIH